jgi:hypothetical protein
VPLNFIDLAYFILTPRVSALTIAQFARFDVVVAAFPLLG